MRRILASTLTCAGLWALLTSGVAVPNQDFSALDSHDVLMVLFHPRKDASRATPDVSNVRFEVEKGIRVGGRLHIAGKDSPVILLFHGNGEVASDYDMVAPLYTRMGISLLVADYRGYGRSDGSPSSSALLNDANATYNGTRNVLAERGLEASAFFLMGRSLGSAAAIDVASRFGDEIDGLIIESGFAHTFSLIERLGGPSLSNVNEERNGFNNSGKMEQVTVPTLIIHGENDSLILVTEGKALFERCAARRKEFVAIPGAGHNDLLLRGRDIYFGAVREFVFGRSRESE